MKHRTRRVPRCPAPGARLFLAAAALAGLLGAPSPARPQTAADRLSPDPPDFTAEVIGDTLTVIQRPLLNIPAFVTPGGMIPIECEAPAGATAWSAELTHGFLTVPLRIAAATYDEATGWWRLTAEVPDEVLSELFDLRVTASPGIADVTRHAVKVLPSFRRDYYFVHVTDTHLPTHRYYYESGAAADSTATADFRAVVNDINIINPEFVLHTGDLVNEGELEDYLLRRYYTRAQRLLAELQVPVFLTAGNHDLGGWSSTPPPAGTARRDWWRFFGWKRLGDPPAAAPARTQDYSFDYGPVHYTGLEAYLNYDSWRSEHYAGQSFTAAQLQWLGADLASAAGSAAQVLFYHYDFGNEVSLSALGVEMALYGHIHRDDGSLLTRPYDLATGATVDGNRSYRVVRVHDGVLTPLATVSAGPSGQNLRAAFSPANDGRHATVTATVTNSLPIRFENALLRFLMPKQEGGIEVTGGTLLQMDTSSPASVVCYVGLDLAANSVRTVSVTTDTTGTPPGPPPPSLLLAQNAPNPFAPQTVIGFDLPRPGRVTLAIFAPDGRELIKLVDEILDSEPHTFVWDGRDGNGRLVPSGTYFYRLATPDGVRSRALTILR
jgi:hypothetical protein